MWAALFELGASGAPRIVEWLAAGSAVFLAVFLGRINLLRGRLAARPAERQVELAGAIIDDKTAAAIIAAMEKQTAETGKLVSALRATIRALEMSSNSLQANTDSVKYAGAMIDEARTDIRRLTDELMRGK